MYKQIRDFLLILILSYMLGISKAYRRLENEEEINAIGLIIEKKGNKSSQKKQQTLFININMIIEIEKISFGRG